MFKESINGLLNSYRWYDSSLSLDPEEHSDILEAPPVYLLYGFYIFLIEWHGYIYFLQPCLLSQV